MLIPNVHVFPPDGYYFVDANGVKHVGVTWSDLEEKIVAYRAQNGLPPGTPKLEIIVFTCTRFPSGCREATLVTPGQAAAPTKPNGSAMKLHARVNRWFYKILQSLGDTPQRMESKETAESRAKICAACPRQKSWVGDCGTCAGSTYRLGVQIRSNRDVKDADQLMGCESLGEDTRTSVWLPNLRPVESDLLPPTCWRKSK